MKKLAFHGLLSWLSGYQGLANLAIRPAKSSLHIHKSNLFWHHWFIGFLMIGIVVITASQSDLLRSISFWGLSGAAWVTLAVTLTTFLLNALTTLPTELIFLGGTAVLLLTKVLSAKEALAGFSNDGVITIAVLYIVVLGLEQTGGMVWMSQQILGRPRSINSAMARLMFPVVAISSLLNNTPVVAMFLPVVLDWCKRLRISPSKLMIPLSYSAIFGGICTLIGTSTNLVVNGMIISEAKLPGLSLFDITCIGLPCSLIGILYLTLGHRWLLPERKSTDGIIYDLRQYTLEFQVESQGGIVGKTIEKAGLRHLPGLFLVEIVRAGDVIAAVSPQEKLQENDHLVFVGAVDSIADLQKMRGLRPATNQVFKLDGDRSKRCLIEAVVSNACPCLGKSIRDSSFRNLYNAVVLSVSRNGERMPGKIGDIVLRPGDSLLLEASPQFIRQRRLSRDFFLVSEIPDSEPLRHDKAPLALLILLGMVVLTTLLGVDMLRAAILAAVFMILCGCCALDRILSSIEWPVILVIAAALGLGRALESTGVATILADHLFQFTGNSPWVALVLTYGATMLITEIISNNAAAALVFPIALALSRVMQVNFIPFAIAIMIAASAGFATPIGYQTHLMVYGPGGYKFSDFLRVGIPLNLIFWLFSSLLIPVFYPFVL